MTGPAQQPVGAPTWAEQDTSDIAQNHDPVTLGTGPVRNYLTRSEERVAVRTVRVRSGWARVEKHVITEMRTITVPVSREQIRILFFDADGVATDADGSVIDPATVAPPHGLTVDHEDDTSAFSSEQQRWLTVSEEQVLVTKKIVPLERVGLQVQTVTEERHITEQVRVERISSDPELSLSPIPGRSPRSGQTETTLEENR